MGIEIVWERVVKHTGEPFTQIRGKQFTYRIKGSTILPSTTNQVISKSEIEKALDFVPMENTVEIQHLRGPSYIYAILMDARIRDTDW